MIGERESSTRQMAGVSTAGQRGVAQHDRRAPSKLRDSRQATALPVAPAAGDHAFSPLSLFVLLIAAQGLAITACNILLALVGPAGPGRERDYVEAAMAGLGVAVLFAIIRPMIRFSTADAKNAAVTTLSVPGTLAALALAELAALGGYAYLAHYFGTTIPPVSFHIWLRAWAMATAAVGLLDLGAGWISARWLREGRLARRIVVYGGGEHGARFITEVAARWPGRLIVRGYFDDRAETLLGSIAGVPWLGDSQKLVEHVRSEQIDEIVIALPWSADQRILEILRRFRHLPVPIRLAPELIAFSTADGQPGTDRLATFTIREQPVSEWNMIVKNMFDRVLASFLLLLAMPTMAVIAVLIKLDSPGPIFFRQKRLGFNNRPFNVLKFRTMSHGGGSEDGVRQAQRGDRRVTCIGRFLRRSSLDELPQLFNVLRGEMSLVGPRPHPIWARAGELWPDQGDRPLDAIFSEYASRHRMKPGITGWAQVCGYRGETETVDKMAKRVEHDIYYIDNWSLWLDVRILAKTLLSAVADKNAY